MFKNQNGFAHYSLIFILLLFLTAAVFTGWKVMSAEKKSSSSVQIASSGESKKADCSTKPTLQAPADLSKATSVLYPGQTRGGHYKSHGGLRFDTSMNSDISVKAPINAKLTSASRYIEQGDTQILLEFTADCNIVYRFDHLLTLSGKIQKAVDAELPAPKQDDSRTTKLKRPVEVSAGETVATAVGFKRVPNVGFDFGVYDMGVKNGATGGQGSLDQHGVCWLKGWLSEADSARLAILPAGDMQKGKTSDICK